MVELTSFDDLINPKLHRPFKSVPTFEVESESLLALMGWKSISHENQS